MDSISGNLGYDYLYTQSSTGCNHPHYDSEKARAADHGVPGLSYARAQRGLW
jgi:hypothetical protein